MTQRSLVDNAELYFTTGVLPFEQSLAGKNSHALNDGAHMLYGTHVCEHGHQHADNAPDPHYWSNVDGARIAARNMTNALIEAYPKKADIFSARFDKYLVHLDSLNATLDSITKLANPKTFAIWHPSLSYFAHSYGLRQLPLGSEGKELSAKALSDAITQAREAGVKVFFLQREYDTRQATTINQGIGSRLVEIDPLAYDWEKQLINAANELARP